MFDVSDLWYVGRGSGLVAEAVLTAAVVLGTVSTVPGGRTGVRRRVALQGLHRQLTMAGVVLLVLHVGTLVLDRWVDLDLVDLVVPFGSSYRTLWLGLGTLAVDLLAAVVVTSLLRTHLAPRAWRSVHLLAYAAWAMAVVHGLQAGTDAGALPVRLLAAGCATAVGTALVVRLEATRVGRRHPAPGEPIGVRR